MKEINERSFSEECSVKEMDITKNSILQFRKVLENKDYYTINLNKFDPEYINIKSESFLKIIQMMQSYPEENIVFIFNNKVLYTPRDSLRLSKSSIDNNNNSSFSSSFKKENMKHIKEEIINTDIINPKIDNIINNNNNDNNNIKENILFETNNKEDIEYMKNLKNMQNMNKNILPDAEKEEIINRNKKFIIFKWIFHFYLIIGIIILLHYLTFIFSEYNDYYYKWVCIALIISLIYVGGYGIKYTIPNNQTFIFSERNLFRTNFFIFILTMISLIGLIMVGGNLQFIKDQGFIGYLIVLIYIITIIIEAIYAIYYDIIIEEISLEKINSNNRDFNKNDLNIQLVDVN